jgi:phosphoribosylglycinamide formyltransferase-1
VTGAAPSRASRLAVLISGRGSNLQAIHRAIMDRRLAADIAIVIANRPEASGLVWARDAGLETVCLDHRQFRDRQAYDRALAAALEARGVDLVCLAGFMRLLGDPVISAYPHRILNIHPSLLPAFPGLDAQRQALEHGVKVTGATVHFVTPELDAGPIVRQAAVPVRDDDTVESLSARILVEEHRIYPEAIGIVLGGRYTFHARRFVPLPEDQRA